MTDSNGGGVTDSNDSDPGGAGDPGSADAPRLAPRPIHRPRIDATSAKMFGRPDGVAGSFSDEADRERTSPDIAVRPPDPILAEAFGRPADATETLQRDPDRSGSEAAPAAAAPADPWRDPDAPATLGAPAARAPEPDARPGRKLSAREVLFGGAVAPRALAALGGFALLVGLAGGLVAVAATADRGALTSQRVTLAQERAGENLGATQVGRVADAVLPSVVSIQVALGDQGSTGSGVVIDGAGYVVTNNHVISAAAERPDATIQVIFSDGSKTRAEIVGRDIKTDLAVLRVAADNLTVARLGSEADVSVGDDVVAVGSPLGLSETITAGIVSAMQRPVRLSGQGTDTNAVIDAIQTDAAINHGNSGGALVDAEGRVIGINTAMLSDSGGSVGLGFAIPIDDVTTVAQTLIRDGAMHHPDFGLNARTVVNEATSGAEVANVRADGPAGRAGIVEGDVIVRVGDRSVASADELVVAVNATAIGESVPVQIVRDGRTVDLDVTPVSD